MDKEQLDPEIEKDYQEFWKGIVEKDGIVDLDQVKKELFDWHMAMQEVSKVYCEITGGQLSYPTYKAESVIDAYNNANERWIDDAVDDRTQDLSNDIADLKLEIRLLKKKLRAKKPTKKKA